MAEYGFTVNCNGNVVAQMKQIEEALSGMGITAKVQTEEAEGAFTRLGESVKETFGGLKSMLLGGLGIGAAFEVFDSIKESKEFFDQNEASIAKVNAALTSTKGIAGETAEHLADVAKSMDGKVIFGKPQIEDAESMLLTFTGIRGEIYDKTIPAIADFATRFKMDLPEAANTLGKALNDPLKGMTRLQRQGVVFSASQKETIKNFVATGQVAKAQQVILNELGNEFGGLSQAMAQTDEGKIQMAGKRWDEIKLTIGGIVSKIQVDLIPVIDTMANAVQGLIDFFKSSSTEATIFKDILVAVGAALVIYYTYLGIVATWTGIVTAAQWAWNTAMAASPMTWVIVGIIAIVAVVAILWDKFKGFREFLGGFWGGLKQDIKDIGQDFMDIGAIIKDVFTGHFKQALEDGKKLISDFSSHNQDEMTKAIKAGADAAGNSTFKFSNLLTFGGGAGETDAQKGTAAGGGLLGSAVKDNAIKTSELAGAKGGLGQAKVVNITFKDALQKIVLTDGRDIKSRAESGVQVMLRTINNISESSSSTQ